MYKRQALVTIKTDCDLPVGLDDLARFTPDNDKLTVFYTDLELNQFLRQLSSAPPDNLQSVVKSGSVEISYELVNTPERLEFWVSQCRNSTTFALDTETTSLVARNADLVGISLAYEAGRACYIPISHVEGDQLDTKVVLNLVASLLADPSLTMVGHNLKYDLTVLELSLIHI